MRLFIGALLLAFLPVGLGKASCLGSSSQDTADAVAIYDPNPAHLWNQLHPVLFIRDDLPDTKLVPDSLDPPLWGSTRYLLAEPSNERVLRILDEFLQTHSERLSRPCQASNPAARSVGRIRLDGGKSAGAARKIGVQ